MAYLLFFFKLFVNFILNITFNFVLIFKTLLCSYCTNNIYLFFFFISMFYLKIKYSSN